MTFSIRISRLAQHIPIDVSAAAQADLEIDTLEFERHSAGRRDSIRINASHLASWDWGDGVAAHDHFRLIVAHRIRLTSTGDRLILLPAVNSRQEVIAAGSAVHDCVPG